MNFLKTILRWPSWTIRFIIFLIAVSFFKIRVKGQKNLPNDSGALLVSNHVTLLDALFIIAAVPRMVRFVMIKKVYDKPFVHYFFKLMNMIPIDVGNSKNALEDFNNLCQKEINEGNVVCIFAEGQLSRNGHLQGFKKGVEHIAKGIKAPIIPLHMEGLHQVPLAINPVTHKLNPFSFVYLFKKVFVTIGEELSPKTSSFVLRKRIKELEMNNISWRLEHYQILDMEEHIIQRNYHTLKRLFPVGGDYLFVSDLQNTSVIHKMIQTYFSKGKTGDVVLCTTKAQLESRIEQNEFPRGLGFIFIVDGIFLNHDSLKASFPKLVIYEGWADMEGFPIISLNTNDWEGRGLDGKVIVQEGKKERSVGRVLHGVAIKLINEGKEVTSANTMGEINLKFLPEMDWVDSGKIGFLDDGGFLWLNE